MNGSRLPNSTVVNDRSSSNAGKPYGRNIRKIPKPILADETQPQSVTSVSHTQTTPIIPLQETSTVVNEHVAKSRPVCLTYCHNCVETCSFCNFTSINYPCEWKFLLFSR